MSALPHPHRDDGDTAGWTRLATTPLLGVAAPPPDDDGDSWLSDPTDVAATPGVADAPPSMDAFSRALRDAEILDVRAVELPGAYALLPFGVRLMRRYRELVRAHLEAAGLVEYEYPSLTPMTALEPTDALFPLEGRLLTVHHGERVRAALAPTGEAPIYHHWSQLGVDRFPIEMYRCATYFRPARHGKRSGRSVFSAIETPDVFELHCAYADLAQQQRALARMFDALTAILRAFHLPTLWSRRPAWTNHGALFHESFASDVPSPTRDTIFCGALYDQRAVFSTAYGVRAGSPPAPTQQVTGAVTRRLLFCHLLLGMRASGAFSVHPDLSPDQVVLIPSADEPSRAAAATLHRRLVDDGARARVATEAHRSSRALLARQGTPLVIDVRAVTAERLDVRFRRGDTGARLAIAGTSAAEIAARVRVMLTTIGHAWTRAALSSATARVVHVRDLGELPEVLRARLVGVVPLDPTPQATAAIEGWGLGEVLGFRPDPSNPRRALALASPRR